MTFPFTSLWVAGQQLPQEHSTQGVPPGAPRLPVWEAPQSVHCSQHALSFLRWPRAQPPAGLGSWGPGPDHATSATFSMVAQRLGKWKAEQVHFLLGPRALYQQGPTKGSRRQNGPCFLGSAWDPLVSAPAFGLRDQPLGQRGWFTP